MNVLYVPEIILDIYSDDLYIEVLNHKSNISLDIIPKKYQTLKIYEFIANKNINLLPNELKYLFTPKKIIQKCDYNRIFCAFFFLFIITILYDRIEVLKVQIAILFQYFLR